MNTAPPPLSDSDGPPPAPAQPAATDVPRRRSLRWLAVFAFIYFYSFPYFEKLWSANEVPRVFLAEEMVDHHRLSIDLRMTGEARMHALDVGVAPNGHFYPDKAPGLSFLAVPVYSLARLFGHPSMRTCTWLFRVLIVTLPALIFLPFFLAMARRFAPDERACRTALVSYALASPAMVYSILFISHQVAAVCVGGAFLAAVALAHRIGETFAAVVTGVTPKGVFVRVLGPPVEGLLIRGQQGVDVGDRLRVKLVSADPRRGYIDFAA